MLKKIEKVNRYLNRGLRLFEVSLDEIILQNRIEINLDELKLNGDIKIDDESKYIISIDIDSKHFKTKFFKLKNGSISLYNEKFVYYDKVIPYQINFRLDMLKDNDKSIETYKTIAESDITFHNLLDNVVKKDMVVPLYKKYKNPSVQISYAFADNDPSNVHIDLFKGTSFNDPYTMKHPLTFFLKLKVYDKRRYKTKIKTNVYEEESDPVFNKTFPIELKKDVYYFMIIEIYEPISKKKIYSSKEMKISYNELKSLKRNNEQWIELYKKKKYMNQESIGKLNMNVYFNSQQILPEIRYDDLYKLLNGKNMYIIEFIEQNCKDINEKKKILNLMIKAFHIKDQASDFIKSIMKREINKTWDYDILFRENTSACLSMEIYMNKIGKEFIQEILKNKYNDNKGSLLIDNNNDEENDNNNEEKKTSNNNNDTLFIRNFIDDMLIDLNSNIHLFPSSLKNILCYIRKQVMKKFNRQDDRTITSFIFLRFICVALAHPHHYDVINDIPTDEESKLYIQLSKTFIKITNYSFYESSSSKESLNEWEKDKVKLIESFINSLIKEDNNINDDRKEESNDEDNKKKNEETSKSSSNIHKDINDNTESLIINKNSLEYMNEMNMIYEWFHSNVSLIKSESDKLNELISSLHYSLSSKSSSEKLETKNNEIESIDNSSNKKMSQSSDQVLLKRSRSKSGSSFYTSKSGGSNSFSSLSKSSNQIEKAVNLKFLKSYKECMDKLLECVLILKEVTNLEDGRIRSISMSG